MMKPWHVYLLRCCDSSLYCGISLDPYARLKKHNAGKGAKYVASRLPAEIVFVEGPMTHREALLREIQIKRLSKKQKEKLVCVVP